MPEFPSWWEKDGVLKRYGSFEEVPADWARCNGTYNEQTGQWEDKAFDPLDHDGDGKKGGSASGRDAVQAAAMRALRKEYFDKLGKKPFSGWDEATLREKMAAG
mgnify:CR=1 FL=1